MAGGAKTPARMIIRITAKNIIDHISNNLGMMRSRFITSFPNRFKIWPIAVVSNHTIRCRKVLTSMVRCKTREDLKKYLALRIACKKRPNPRATAEPLYKMQGTGSANASFPVGLPCSSSKLSVQMDIITFTEYWQTGANAAARRTQQPRQGELHAFAICIQS